MISEEEQSLSLREKRISKLQSMLGDIKKEIMRKVLKISQDASSNKKHRKNRRILSQRARKTTNFIRNSCETFFALMSNEQSLSLTTEADVIQKVQKFKKNVNNACQKMMQNVDDGDDSGRGFRIPESKLQQNSQSDDEGEYKNNSLRRSPSKSRSKNFKISHQSTLSMMEWLLQNFENPYPSSEEKTKMAEDGNLTVQKVNNWFINARERTVKSYFNKE